jgi:hypothetical protein
MRSQSRSRGKPRALQVTAVALLILAFAVGSAVGDMQAVQSEEAPEDATAVVEYEVDDDEDQSVTMAIEMEEGGEIDLEMARGDVVIDTWDGNELLVIVEKKQRPEAKNTKRPATFKVTRHGKNVRIDALDNFGHRLTNLDLSYRIVVPKDRQVRKSGGSYDLSKLSALIFRALHREALDWLMR